jgi:hypothetical protein
MPVSLALLLVLISLVLVLRDAHGDRGVHGQET